MSRKNSKPVCDDFDSSLKAYGVCKTCQHTLAEHLSQQEGGDVAALEEAAEAEAEEARRQQEVEAKANEPKACHNFTFAINSTRTDMCDCGFPKDDHVSDSKHVSFRMSFQSVKNRVSKRVTKGLGGRSSAKSSRPKEPCDNFEIDLEGDHYGLCNCGFNKVEHDRAAAYKAEEAEEKRKRAAGIKKAAPGAPTAPCADFNLDLTNGGGYGVCRECGFKRDEHVDFKVRECWCRWVSLDS